MALRDDNDEVAPVLGRGQQRGDGYADRRLGRLAGGGRAEKEGGHQKRGVGEVWERGVRKWGVYQGEGRA